MVTRNQRPLSDMPIPPGEVLEEELEARGMTQKELAGRLGRPTQAINEIIRGKKAITPDTAIGLGKVFGIGAHFWTSLEADYQMALAMIRDREELAASEKYLKEYPISEMQKLEWIATVRDKASKVKALMNFLGVANVEPRTYQQAVGFRVTEAARTKVSLGALTVWLRKGELDAQEMSTAEYDEGAFEGALDRIRPLTGQRPEEFLPEVERLCAEAGVAFCLVRELPKSGANGVARWLSNRKAMIQVSTRHKWADIFWFTFFHEAYHLLRHRNQRQFVIDGLDSEPEMEEMEEEANLFARDFLIPPEEWTRLCELSYDSPETVDKFAQSIGIAPFIVVGRLQKEEYIAYNQLTDLKKRYRWAD